MCNFKIDFSNLKIQKDYSFKISPQTFNNGRFEAQIA